MGLLAAFLSTVFAASKDLVSKRLASRLHGTVSTFASFAFALPFYLVALLAFALLGQNPVVPSWFFVQLVLLRALTDSFAEGMKMYALALSDISLVASFMSLSPIFLLFLTPLITHDATTPAGAVAVVVVVGGSLLLVYRPSSADWARQRKGLLLGIGASFLFSLNTCLDTLASRLGQSYTSDLAAAVFSGFAVTLAAAVFVFPFVLRRAHWGAMREQQTGLWCRGLLEVAFMVSKLYAVQYVNPAYVMSIQRLALLVSIIGGRVFFREGDFGRRLAAGLLIVFGVVAIAWLQTWESAPVSPP
jgi:drug/metabolite transporter (DMT)-like permease